jgi:hypothetical protein
MILYVTVESTKGSENFKRHGDLSCRFVNFVNCIVNEILVVTVEREYAILNEEVVFII